jgi:methionyl-tRNA formyltransferase
LNLHCGTLPEIRGMNGVEWNLFFGKPPEVTLHFIDAGIDTGRILASRVIEVTPNDRLGRLRGKAIVAGIELLAELLPRIDQLPSRENPPREGRQYFAMAETLKALIDDRRSHPPEILWRAA